MKSKPESYNKTPSKTFQSKGRIFGVYMVKGHFMKTTLENFTWKLDFYKKFSDLRFSSFSPFALRIVHTESDDKYLENGKKFCKINVFDDSFKSLATLSLRQSTKVRKILNARVTKFCGNFGLNITFQRGFALKKN